MYVLQVHFFIPLLALKDVQRAVTTLQTEIEKLLSTGGENAGFFFDSSEFFNLSYRLATAFPDLWESNLIRSYHSSQPPVHLLNSDIGVNTSQDDAIFGSSLLAALFRRTAVVAGTMMLYFGTINIRIQKMVITASQPLILAGICLMFYEMVHAKWIVIFPCVGLVMLFYYQFRHHSKAGSSGDGKIGVEANDTSINEHSKQSRSLDRLSLRHTPQHDRHEEKNGEHRQGDVCGVQEAMEVAGASAEEEVRRGGAVETLPGGVHKMHHDDDNDSNSDVDGEDSLSEDPSSGDVEFSGRISWESDSNEEPIAASGEGEEGLWWRAWEEEELPDHLSLSSDDEELFGDFFIRKRPRPAYPMAATAEAGAEAVGRRWEESEEDAVTGAALLTGSSSSRRGGEGRILSGRNRPANETEEQRSLRVLSNMVEDLLLSRLNRLKAGEPENPDGPDINALVAMIIREREAATNAAAAATAAVAEIVFNNVFRDMQTANAAAEAAAGGVSDIDQKIQDGIGAMSAYPIAATAALGRRWEESEESEEDAVTGAALLTGSSSSSKSSSSSSRRGGEGRILSGRNRPANETEEQRSLRVLSNMVEDLLLSRLNRLKAGEPENPDGPDINALVAMIIREREAATNAAAAATAAVAEIVFNNVFRDMQTTSS
jgi:hypothetical protein